MKDDPDPKVKEFDATLGSVVAQVRPSVLEIGRGLPIVFRDLC